MIALGLPPVLPPSASASRIEALRGLWTDAGLAGVETHEITVQRTFAGFDDFWSTTTGWTLKSRSGDGSGHRRATEGTGSPPSSGRWSRTDYVQHAGQRSKGPRAKVGVTVEWWVGRPSNGRMPPAADIRAATATAGRTSAFE